MTATLAAPDFALPDELVATVPPEWRGLRRDQVRLLVSRPDRDEHTAVSRLERHLRPGDLLVVNDSATLAAALPVGDDWVLHLSTPLPGAAGDGAGPLSARSGLWVVELRRPAGRGTAPAVADHRGRVLALPAGAHATLLAPYPLDLGPPSRLWVAALRSPTRLATYLASAGRPIRYGDPPQVVPLGAYQTVFARHPGSAEMPSAGRPLTRPLLRRLRRRGVGLAQLTLHAALSSQEDGEPPQPERYAVPARTARALRATRRSGGRVVAVGTTVVRALETIVRDGRERGVTASWTDHVVTPESGVRVVDGLLTGWHEPRSSHLAMLAAVAGRDVVARAYATALDRGYLWHEFGDSHLLFART